MDVDDIISTVSSNPSWTAIGLHLKNTPALSRQMLILNYSDIAEGLTRRGEQLADRGQKSKALEFMIGALAFGVIVEAIAQRGSPVFPESWFPALGFGLISRVYSARTRERVFSQIASDTHLQLRNSHLAGDGTLTRVKILLDGQLETAKAAIALTFWSMVDEVSSLLRNRPF
jgi:hypothetical protein